MNDRYRYKLELIPKFGIICPQTHLKRTLSIGAEVNFTGRPKDFKASGI